MTKDAKPISRVTARISPSTPASTQATMVETGTGVFCCDTCSMRRVCVAHADCGCACCGCWTPWGA